MDKLLGVGDTAAPQQEVPVVDDVGFVVTPSRRDDEQVQPMVERTPKANGVKSADEDEFTLFKVVADSSPNSDCILGSPICAARCVAKYSFIVRGLSSSDT